ncbi:unnamed protein product, partial [Medioppia subpectinata]
RLKCRLVVFTDISKDKDRDNHLVLQSTHGSNELKFNEGFERRIGYQLIQSLVGLNAAVFEIFFEFFDVLNPNTIITSRLTTIFRWFRQLFDSCLNCLRLLLLLTTEEEVLESMVRFAQIIIGPAGSGKSSYVSAMVRHCQAMNRTVDAFNLDPAAEHFDYQPVADIRELITVEDIMADDELRFGPNGGLVFAMEYLLENMDWFEERLGDVDNDYLLFDTAGQIELSTHLDVMRRLIAFLQSRDFRVCAIFLLDSQFVSDMSKFFSALMVSLSAMISLDVPVVNLLTKTDLLDKSGRKRLDTFLEPDSYLLEDRVSDKWGEKHRKLTEAFGKLVDDYSLIKFMPISVLDEDSLNDILITVDNVVQFDEEQDVKVRDFDEPEVNENDDNNFVLSSMLTQKKTSVVKKPLKSPQNKVLSSGTSISKKLPAHGENWPKHGFSGCGGEEQSPIRLVTADATSQELHLNFRNYRKPIRLAFIENNGHTVQIGFSDKFIITVYGSASNNKAYIFSQMHFHWGSYNAVGSEHTIDGYRGLLVSH